MTYPTLSSTIVKAEIESNFAAVRAKFDQGIVDADISTTANIQITKVQQRFQEVHINILYDAVARGVWPAAVADAANITVAEARNAVIVPLPGTDADTAWVVTDVSWACTDCGSVVGSFGVRAGAWNVGGTVWVNTTTIVSSTNLTITTDGNGNHGRALEGGSVSLTQATTLRGIILYSTGQGTGVMTDVTAPGDYLSVTLALRRVLQA